MVIRLIYAHKKSIKWLVLSICLVTSNVWGQISDDIDVEQKKLDNQWLEQFWSYFESSEYPHVRTRAAIRLIKTGDSQSVERGKQLINEILDEPNPDPASLWLLASGCQWIPSFDWCEPGGVHELLKQADPHNAAVILLRFDQTIFDGDGSLDTEANRQLLIAAADANYFDIYWGRGEDMLFEEALAFLEINPMQFAPGSEELVQQFGITAHKYAYYAVLAKILTVPEISIANVRNLCRLQVRNQYPEGTEACQKLADMLTDRSDTMLTITMGISLNKAMLTEADPSDPAIKQWRDRQLVFSVMATCFQPYWQTNLEISSEEVDASIMNWVKNRSELGEWEGGRLSTFQDYETSPEYFIVDPADCDKLKDLDDEAVEKWINSRSAGELWRSMQDEALGR